MAHFPIEYAEVDSLFRQTIGQGLGVIAISSVEAGEGKTTLSRTLAQRAAITGQTTLLIDLDLAHSELHEAFELDQVDWFPGQKNEFPIQKLAHENLFLLTAPKQSANRWEFRDLASLLACLNDLRSQFEVIIIDTSPLMQRNQGNIPPEMVCTCADGTLLCVMTGRTSESKVRDAFDVLRSVNANVHGAVLNDRYAPALVSELVRETFRFEKLLPKLMEKCRDFLRNSTLLNQDI